MKSMPKDETIEKWIKSSGSKEAFEKEMLRRLDVVEEEYRAKKTKIQYILKRLKSL
ncbi:hypothetical protein JXM83_05135 [Candidatus Woesearchaeota archaeon]|nr:hypothetical protein [Candidatus Woesearchaeota archaeon]